MTTAYCPSCEWEYTDGVETTSIEDHGVCNGCHREILCGDRCWLCRELGHHMDECRHTYDLCPYCEETAAYKDGGDDPVLRICNGCGRLFNISEERIHMLVTVEDLYLDDVVYVDDKEWFVVTLEEKGVNLMGGRPEEPDPTMKRFIRFTKESNQEILILSRRYE